MRTAVYVALAIALALFGYLALFSIGFPFLLTGVLMLALFGRRGKIEVMVPALLWPWAFTLGYLLVAPLGCSQTTRPAVGAVESATRCGALFFDYAGGASYDPPIWPALLVGAVLATGVAWLARRAITRGRSLDPKGLTAARG